jgi:DNA-binding transcriptional LysR family regulator
MGARIYLLRAPTLLRIVISVKLIFLWGIIDLMDIGRLDLNLLVVFDAIFQAKSVSIAARQLNLSQPSVSSALSRLRQIVKDQLFVRTREGMIPTKRALELAQPVQQALNLLRQAMVATEEFVPERSDRTFTLLLSEIGQVTFLPKISEMIKNKAPKIRLVIAEANETKYLDNFENGKIDLAIGVWSHLKNNIVRKELFSEDWLCVVRKKHPSIGERLTLKTFLEAQHIAVSSVNGGDEVLDRVLRKMGLKRNIALEVTDFLAPPMVVARTDLIATVPSLLARLVASCAPLMLFTPPIELPPIRLALYWHKRLEDDSGRQWLAQAITDLFATRRRRPKSSYARSKASRNASETRRLSADTKF